MTYVAEKIDTKISYELLTSLVERARLISDQHRAVKIKHVYQAALRAFYRLTPDEQLALLRNEITGDTDEITPWEDVTPPSDPNPRDGGRGPKSGDKPPKPPRQSRAAKR